MRTGSCRIFYRGPFFLFSVFDFKRRRVRAAARRCAAGHSPKAKTVRTLRAPPQKKRNDDKMNLRIELKNGVMTAAMHGDLDHHAAAGLREEIDSTAKKVRPKVLRLDFSEVPFMDSSGIGLILGRVRMAALWNGRVAVTGLSPQLRRMAELSGIASLAALEDPAEEDEK